MLYICLAVLFMVGLIIVIYGITLERKKNNNLDVLGLEDNLINIGGTIMLLSVIIAIPDIVLYTVIGIAVLILAGIPGRIY